MSIVRDNCDERQARVDRMFDEFRKAQSRRLAKVTAVKGDHPVMESQRHAHDQTAVGSTTTPIFRLE